MDFWLGGFLLRGGPRAPGYLLQLSRGPPMRPLCCLGEEAAQQKPCQRQILPLHQQDSRLCCSCLKEGAWGHLNSCVEPSFRPVRSQAAEHFKTHSSSSSSSSTVLMLRQQWREWLSLRPASSEQQRGFAARTATAAAAKKRRKGLQRRRQHWQPPKVPQRYLREEGDAVAPKNPRLKAGGDLKGGAPYKVQDLEGPWGPPCEDTGGVRFLERQKKPHEYALETAKASRRRQAKEGTPQQRQQGALLPLAEALPSLQRADIQEETSSSLLSHGRPQGRFGVRGAYATTERDFYKRFFRDRDRALDGRQNELHQMEKELQGQSRPRGRRYIPPKEYWYSGEHEPPSALTASSLGARDLKFVLMREARRIRLTGEVDISVWSALEARASRICRDTPNVSVKTILRMLQAFASVQLPLEPSNIEVFMLAIVKRQAEMRPENYVHLFQALSRLRLKHRVCLLGLQEMMLSWSVLRNNFLIKAANSLSKLDLVSHVGVTPLKLVLAVRIPGFTAQNCRSVKWVTAVTLFSSPMLIDFLHCAAKQPKRYLLQRHSRDLQLMELYLRLQKPEVYDQLNIETQYFLEVLRNVSTSNFSDSSDDEEEAEGALGEPPAWAVCTPRDMPEEPETNGKEAAYREEMEAEGFYTPADVRHWPLGAACGESPSGEAPQQEERKKHEETRREEGQAKEAEPKVVFSSALHKDISRVLNLMAVAHVNAAVAGPLKADMFLPQAKTVIEAVSAYQFYTNTQTPTALSRLRHELLAGMGFQVLLIQHRQWLSLASDEDKINLLRHLLPSVAFSEAGS